MSGAESQDERTEEEREDAAKEREIREMEEHLWHHLWPHEPGFYSPSLIGSSPEKMRAVSPASSSGSMMSARSMDFPFSLKRSEREREAAAALDRVLMEMELKEEHIALIRTEEEREDPAALMCSMEERLTFIDSSTIPFTMGGVKEKLQYFERLSEEDEWAEEGTEFVPAMDREIMEMKFLEEQFALNRFGFSPEQERAGSPASSCGSTMSDDSMDYPMAF